MRGIRVAIVSTAHWEGDPRLNRHREYLIQAGHGASIVTHRGIWRPLALVRALVDIFRSDSQMVILPDPELYFLGALAARLSGKRPVVDIHEDYPQAAMARQWVPEWARLVVRLGAAAAVGLGRVAAWRVMVAGAELAEAKDTVVLNVPDPASLSPAAHDGSRRLVYVGDVTEARGALSMVEMLGHLDESYHLQLIGRVGASTREQIEESAGRLGVSARVEIVGQREHAEAWEKARGALAGLNLLQPVPAYRDAVATKLWEYMAVGLPVIVSDLPGQAAVIGGIDPRLVVAGPEEAAATARLLAGDPGLRVSLAETSRSIVEAKWEASRPDLAIQGLAAAP